MSAAELRARIDQISADIARQKELVKALERDKGAAQRQLNALFDPFARLPLEISSEIFIQCLPPRPKPGARLVPMLFLNVSKAWTAITLSTSALWTTIHMDEPVVDRASVLDAWLKRTAGSRAVSISLRANLTGGIAPVIGRHAHQLHKLGIFHDDDCIRLLAAAGPFPSLNTLTIAAEADRFHSGAAGLDTTAAVDLLRVCPNLVECTLDDVVYQNNRHAAEESVVIPHLQRFTFGTHPYASGDGLLPHFYLPGLQNLSILLERIQVSDLLQFFRRSSPPLQKLVMGDTTTGKIRWSREDVEECLSLLPTLTHFELRQVQPDDAANHFLAILASSQLSPTLSAVTLRFRHSPAVLWYQELYRALSSRRNPDLALRILWSSDSSLGPPETIVSKLRGLVTDGITLQLGTREHDYI
ncbi:hypothetical protein FB451DRAFT_1367983 [Mycena latifolia]|nr:hypothetical protein FB451DRAFT_1367983 [Mycena latifolia]